jgi:hypothetical protein
LLPDGIGDRFLIARAGVTRIIALIKNLIASGGAQDMGTINLRCEGNLYGRLTDNRWLEVKCKRRACGHRPGTVILHTIDITTGKVVKTDCFAEPRNRKERHNASDQSPASLRTA